MLKTPVATSIVSYLERIPWASVTPQMLSDPEGTPLAAVKGCAWILMHLSLTVMDREAQGSRSAIPALMLQQVNDLSFHRSLLPNSIFCTNTNLTVLKVR